MKEKIQQLAKEEFEYSSADLVLEEEWIEREAGEGTSVAGSLVLRNSDNRSMKGAVYAAAPFIHLQETAFEGTEALLAYELSSLDGKAGEKLSGEICIVTSCGERKLRVELAIKENGEKEKAGNISHLASLAKSDWAAAVEQYKELGFKPNGIGPSSQELEELLIDGGEKQKIMLCVDKNSFRYEAVVDSFADSLVLMKDGWGYIKINVWSDAAFLQSEHKVIWSDNFIGEEYRLEFLVDREMLHEGKNYGRLYVKTVHQLLVVEVCAACQARSEEKARARKRKEAKLLLFDNYLKYRRGLLGQTAYAREGLAWRRKNPGLFPEEESQLLELYFMALDGQKALAEELLKDVLPKGKEQEAAVFYLKQLCTEEPEEKAGALSGLRKLYQENLGNARLLWFLLQADTERLGTSEQRFAMIEEHHKGRRPSTLLYVELLEAMNEQPPLLKHLTPSLVHALNWGIRKKLVSAKVQERFVFLAANEAEGHFGIKGLKALYRQEESDEVLRAILCILVRRKCYGSRYFRWYEKGIQKQLRLKDLYESYLLSAEERPGFAIPKPVLTYFAYDNLLPDPVKELLYAYVVQHKEEDRAAYQAYFSLMEQFALRRLSQKAMNQRLAVIYPEILKPGKLSSFYLRKLSKLLFRQELICGNPNMAGVSIRHKELAEEEYYPLEDGRAEIYLFTEQPQISFVDGSGSRYGSSVDYRLEKYLDLSDWQQECYYADPENTRLLLHFYEEMEKEQRFDETANEIRKEVLEIKGLQKECQMECMFALIHQYFDRMEGEPLKKLLLRFSPELAAVQERPRLIEYCILQGLKERAYELIKRWGYKGVPPKRLFWLVSRLLEASVQKEEPLLSLCNYLLRCGRCSRATLSYLVLHYEGLLGQMYLVWEKARQNGVETWPMEERLLTQLLFTEGQLEGGFRVFASYYEKNYEKKREHSLVRAYLNFYSYQYFAKGASVPEEFFAFLPREIEREYSRIMDLAYLKSKSEKATLAEQEVQQVAEGLARFLVQNECFAFFKGFQDKLFIEGGLFDGTFVEYHAAPGQKVSLSYRMDESEDFKAIPMTELGYGIYSANFLLFPDEVLEYYVTERNGEVEVATECRTLMGAAFAQGQAASDFELLGAISEARKRKDHMAAEALMEKYILKSYQKEKLFTVL